MIAPPFFFTLILMLLVKKMAVRGNKCLKECPHPFNVIFPQIDRSVETKANIGRHSTLHSPLAVSRASSEATCKSG